MDTSSDSISSLVDSQLLRDGMESSRRVEPGSPGSRLVSSDDDQSESDAEEHAPPDINDFPQGQLAHGAPIDGGQLQNTLSDDPLDSDGAELHAELSIAGTTITTILPIQAFAPGDETARPVLETPTPLFRQPTPSSQPSDIVAIAVNPLTNNLSPNRPPSTGPFPSEIRIADEVRDDDMIRRRNNRIPREDLPKLLTGASCHIVKDDFEDAVVDRLRNDVLHLGGVLTDYMMKATYVLHYPPIEFGAKWNETLLKETRRLGPNDPSPVVRPYQWLYESMYEYPSPRLLLSSQYRLEPLFEQWDSTLNDGRGRLRPLRVYISVNIPRYEDEATPNDMVLVLSRQLESAGAIVSKTRKDADILLLNLDSHSGRQYQQQKKADQTVADRAWVEEIFFNDAKFLRDEKKMWMQISKRAPASHNGPAAGGDPQPWLKRQDVIHKASRQEFTPQDDELIVRYLAFHDPMVQRWKSRKTYNELMSRADGANFAWINRHTMQSWHERVRNARNFERFKKRAKMFRNRGLDKFLRTREEREARQIPTPTPSPEPELRTPQMRTPQSKKPSTTKRPADTQGDDEGERASSPVSEDGDAEVEVGRRPAKKRMLTRSQGNERVDASSEPSDRNENRDQEPEEPDQDEFQDIRQLLERLVPSPPQSERAQSAGFNLNGDVFVGDEGGFDEEPEAGPSKLRGAKFKKEGENQTDEDEELTEADETNVRMDIETPNKYLAGFEHEEEEDDEDEYQYEYEEANEDEQSKEAVDDEDEDEGESGDDEAESQSARDLQVASSRRKDREASPDSEGLVNEELVEEETSAILEGTDEDVANNFLQGLSADTQIRNGGERSRSRSTQIVGHGPQARRIRMSEPGQAMPAHRNPSRHQARASTGGRMQASQGEEDDERDEQQIDREYGGPHEGGIPMQIPGIFYPTGTSIFGNNGSQPMSRVRSGGPTGQGSSRLLSPLPRESPRTSPRMVVPSPNHVSGGQDLFRGRRPEPTKAGRAEPPRTPQPLPQPRRNIHSDAVPRNNHAPTPSSDVGTPRSVRGEEGRIFLKELIAKYKLDPKTVAVIIQKVKMDNGGKIPRAEVHKECAKKSRR